MSKGFVFTALPAEIRDIIYKLAFVSKKPITIGVQLPATRTLSGQLLRTCRTCHQEGSPVLYGKNVFSMIKRYSHPEIDLIYHMEQFGENVNFIRHIEAHYDATLTLNRMRSMRGLRCILQNLDSLQITRSEFETGFAYYSSTPLPNSQTPSFLASVHGWLKATRGPFQNLTRIFVARSGNQRATLIDENIVTIHLISDSTKVKPKVSPFSPPKHITRLTNDHGTGPRDQHRTRSSEVQVDQVASYWAL